MSAVSNDAARTLRVKIPNNMRVPKGSIISKAFNSNDEFVPVKADENLNLWTSSDGSGLNHARVRVEAMRVRDRVWAIMTVFREVVRLTRPPTFPIERVKNFVLSGHPNSLGQIYPSAAPLPYATTNKTGGRS